MSRPTSSPRVPRTGEPVRATSPFADLGTSSRYLHFHHHRQDQRPASGPLPKEPLQLDADTLLQQAGIGALLARRAFDRPSQQIGPPTQNPLVPGVDRQPARDELRRLLESPGLPVDRHDRHDETVAREMTPVAQNLVGNLSRAGAVDENAAGRNAFGDTRAGAVEPQDIAAF